MKATLSLWQMRNLSLIVRIIIVQTQKIPKIIYPSTVLAITKEITTEIDKLITHFIGNNSKPKVKSVEAFHKIN